MSTLALYDSIHEGAFAGMCLNELDALGVDGEAAKAELTYLMAKEACRAAMELEPDAVYGMGRALLDAEVFSGMEEQGEKVLP